MNGIFMTCFMTMLHQHQTITRKVQTASTLEMGFFKNQRLIQLRACSMSKRNYDYLWYRRLRQALPTVLRAEAGNGNDLSAKETIDYHVTKPYTK